jgi:uncharacterized protein YjbJ (UPF0337 family)
MTAHHHKENHMTINNDILQGKWKEITGELQKKWGQLTDSDLHETKGNFHSLVGLLQQKLGMAKEEVETKLQEITDRFSHSANQKIDSTKSEVKSNVKSDSESKKIA